MGLVPKSVRSPTTALTAYALACGVPLAAYFATASAHAHWLDTGELVAASIDLDISHPPGHPLAALLGHVFTLLPIGPLALRIAIAQACCAALACAFLFRAFDTTARVFGLRHDRVTIPIALGGTWLVATSYGWWMQAIRPEVYALEALCIAVVIERIVALEAAWPVHDVRPLYTAAFVAGLGLSNHHFMMILVLPALAPTAARVYRARGGRALAFAGLALAVGLAPYLYLPVRSAAGPPLDLGHPSSISNFLWVVSAQVYSDPSRIPTLGLADRAIDVAALVFDSIHPLPLVLAAGGIWALFRTPGAKRLGYVWVALASASLGGRVWLGQNAGNPDALGYLMPAFMGIGALAVAFVSAAVALIGGATTGTPRNTTVLLALVTAALGVAQINKTADRATLATFHATDEFDDARLRALPPRALVIAQLPETIFRHYAVQAEERIRPDVTVVPTTFLAYPGMVRTLVSRHPELRDLLRGYMLDQELRQADLQSLAGQRPVMLEMDARVPRSLYGTLLPAGLLFTVMDDTVGRDEVRHAAEGRAAAMANISRSLGIDGNDLHTRQQILWIRYFDALYFARLGAIPEARASMGHGLAIAPTSPELLGLSRVLEDPELDSPIDVEPYVVGASGTVGTVRD